MCHPILLCSIMYTITAPISQLLREKPEQPISKKREREREREKGGVTEHLKRIFFFFFFPHSTYVARNSHNHACST